SPRPYDAVTLHVARARRNWTPRTDDAREENLRSIRDPDVRPRDDTHQGRAVLAARTPRRPAGRASCRIPSRRPRVAGRGPVVERRGAAHARTPRREAATNRRDLRLRTR